MVVLVEGTTNPALHNFASSRVLFTFRMVTPGPPTAGTLPLTMTTTAAGALPLTMTTTPAAPASPASPADLAPASPASPVDPDPASPAREVPPPLLMITTTDPGVAMADGVDGPPLALASPVSLAEPGQARDLRRVTTAGVDGPPPATMAGAPTEDGVDGTRHIARLESPASLEDNRPSRVLEAHKAESRLVTSFMHIQGQRSVLFT